VAGAVSMWRNQSGCPCCPLVACPRINGVSDTNRWGRGAARLEGAVVEATHGRRGGQ
jgi:hypothetical protein